MNFELVDTFDIGGDPDYKLDLQEKLPDEFKNKYIASRGLFKVFDGKIMYPESFDLRDWATDLEVLQQAKASMIKSETFTKELDKQIARTVIEDDDTLSQIDEEIDQSTTRLGEFPQTPIETPTV
jgi:hypothetical protein